MFSTILKEGSFDFDYDDVKKIIEYDNSYYMFFKKISIFLDKNGFINGLKAILNKNFKKKEKYRIEWNLIYKESCIVYYLIF